MIMHFVHEHAVFVGLHVTLRIEVIGQCQMFFSITSLLFFVTGSLTEPGV